MGNKDKKLCPCCKEWYCEKQEKHCSICYDESEKCLHNRKPITIDTSGTTIDGAFLGNK